MTSEVIVFWLGLVGCALAFLSLVAQTVQLYAQRQAMRDLARLVHQARAQLEASNMRSDFEIIEYSERLSEVAAALPKGERRLVMKGLQQPSLEGRARFINRLLRDGSPGGLAAG